jgi:DNA-binding beta-propeller fold protein YncE
VEGIRIDPRPHWSVSNEVLVDAEGVALSPSGDLVAVAESEADRVSLFSRSGDPARPVGVLEGPGSGIAYPHDVDFSPDGRLLAVANRNSASITLYARSAGDGPPYGTTPVWTVHRHRSRLGYPDGVKFVPPRGVYLAAVNLTRNSVTFYRRHRLRRSRYGLRPSFVLEGAETRMVQPDGLGFTEDGSLLAVANHGGGTVTIYARRGRGPAYHPTPVAEIGGASARLSCPHSAAFTRGGAYLAVSNAGGRTVGVYRRVPGSDPRAPGWSASPVLEVDACDPTTFDATNRANRQEGGAKGIAFAADCLAICNGAFGLRLHRLEPAPAAG